MGRKYGLNRKGRGELQGWGVTGKPLGTYGKAFTDEFIVRARYRNGFFEVVYVQFVALCITTDALHRVEVDEVAFVASEEGRVR